MKQSFKNFFLHLLVFIVIEIIFVLLLFREFPETNLLTLIGILHTSYWVILLFAGRLRERAKHVWQRGLCTFLPVAYHLFVHLYAGRAAIETHQADDGHAHDEHELYWMIGGAVLLGALIFVGEYILHRKIHCDTHHDKAHAHCHDADCVKKH